MDDKKYRNLSGFDSVVDYVFHKTDTFRISKLFSESDGVKLEIVKFDLEKMKPIGDKLIEETLMKHNLRLLVGSKTYTQIGSKIIFYKVKASQGF